MGRFGSQPEVTRLIFQMEDAECGIELQPHVGRFDSPVSCKWLSGEIPTGFQEAAVARSPVAAGLNSQTLETIPFTPAFAKRAAAGPIKRTSPQLGSIPLRHFGRTPTFTPAPQAGNNSGRGTGWPNGKANEAEWLLQTQRV